MQKFTGRDEFFMKKAIQLARKGAGKTFPNPIVGCVIVKKDRVIASGWHEKAGQNHAEISALKKAKKNATGATMYINLEPCCTHGKTPPCTKEIIKAGIKKIIIAMKDPNPKINGRGIDELKNNKIESKIGLMEKEAQEINKYFMTNIKDKRPYISIKYAMSLDGKIATKTGSSKYLTGQKAQKFTHELRKNHAAILVGINTVIKDNPHLDCRLTNGKNPIRVIIDPKGKIELNSNVLKDKNFIIITTLYKKKFDKISKIGGKILIHKKIQLKRLLKELYQRKIDSILVEGGGTTIAHFIEDGLYERIYAFIAPKIVGGKRAITAVEGKGIADINQSHKVEIIGTRKLDSDILIIAEKN